MKKLISLAVSLCLLCCSAAAVPLTLDFKLEPYLEAFRECIEETYGFGDLSGSEKYHLIFPTVNDFYRDQNGILVPYDEPLPVDENGFVTEGAHKGCYAGVVRPTLYTIPNYEDRVQIRQRLGKYLASSIYDERLEHNLATVNWGTYLVRYDGELPSCESVDIAQAVYLPSGSPDTFLLQVPHLIDGEQVGYLNLEFFWDGYSLLLLTYSPAEAAG